MRKKQCLIHLSCLFFCAAIFVSTAHGQTTNYFPLEIGNYWTFEFTQGAVSFRDSIIGTVKINDTTYYEFSRFSYMPNWFLRLDKQDQLWERRRNKDILRFKFNAAVGDTWSYPDGIIVLESRSDTVAVPAGTFRNCLRFHYYFNGADGDWDEWYAPEIGPVKRIEYGFAVNEYRLKKFKIGQTTGVKLNSIQDLASFPEEFVLLQNSPNPLRLQGHLSSSTRIYYWIRSKESFVDVDLTIYNLVGQKVVTLVKERKSSGYYQAVWEGKNDTGNPVPNGIYFFRLTAGKFSDFKKALILR